MYENIINKFKRKDLKSKDLNCCQVQDGQNDIDNGVSIDCLISRY